MKNETSDIHGNFKEGNICCDNKSCQKVLYKWSDKNDAPDKDRGGYFAYSVKTRFLFSRFPTKLAISAINPSFLFLVQDKHIGYIVDFDVLPLRLDFCSADCSVAWLNDNTKHGMGQNFETLNDKYYGVIVYGENPQELNQLVSDNTSRFTTVVVGNFLPTSAPKNEVKLPNGKQINIAGKFFDIQKSHVILGGEKEPPVGVAMTTLTFKCPMKLSSSPQTCNQLIHVVAEFTPSVWICPKCKGIIIFDKESNNTKHSEAHVDLKSNLTLGNVKISVNYYFGETDWNNVKFVSWVREYIGANIFVVADAYHDNGMSNNTTITSSFISYNDIVNLFGNFM